MLTENNDYGTFFQIIPGSRSSQDQGAPVFLRKTPPNDLDVGSGAFASHVAR